MEKPKKFHHTSHSGQRQKERGIEPARMEDVVRNPDKVQRCGKGMHGGNLYVLRKKRDDRELVVVVECKADECWLITGYYE